MAKPPAAQWIRGDGSAGPPATDDRPLGETSDQDVMAADPSLSVDGGFAPMPSSVGTAAPDFIGVPKGYTVKRPQPAGMPVRVPALPPRYAEGAQLAPASLTPPLIADLQRQLVTAGLLRKTGFILGYWDDASIGAYESLLAMANRSGQSKEALLARMASGLDADLRAEFAGYGADGDPERAPMVLNISNPDDLKALLGDVSGRVIGRKLTDAESAQFVATYQQMERDAGRRNYEVTNPEGPGGESIDAQAPQPLAEDYVRENFANEAITHGALDRFNQFMDLI